jgi:predicted hydrolase (HD superfamily)
LGVQALLEHWWAVGILEKLKWLFDENIYQNKMATHMTNSITIFEETQVECHYSDNP